MFKQFSANHPRLAPFLFGLFGWYLLNTLLWIPIFILLNTTFAPIASQEGLNQLYIIPFCFIPGLVNIGVLIYFLSKRRWSALGWVTAMISNFCIAYALDFLYGGHASVLTGLVSIFGTPFYMLFMMSFGS